MISSEPVSQGGDSEGKADYMGRDPPWGVEGFKPHIGCPSPGVQHRGDKLPWLVGGPVGLTGGLWEAWTLLRRSRYIEMQKP